MTLTITRPSMAYPPDLGEYVSSLIGRPWDRHGMHCWRLVAQVQADLFGRGVPFSSEPMHKRQVVRAMMSLEAAPFGWREIERPVHGAVARMYRNGGDPAVLDHAGVYLTLGRGGVLHTDDPYGVVFDALIELSARGWAPRWFVPVA